MVPYVSFIPGSFKPIDQADGAAAVPEESLDQDTAQAYAFNGNQYKEQDKNAQGSCSNSSSVSAHGSYGRCPNCGYCPTCGRSNGWNDYWRPYPYPWNQPWITY